jgi:hypothetical protein
MNMFSHVTTNSQLTAPVITTVSFGNLKATVYFKPSRGNNVINYLYSTNSGQTFTAFSPAQVTSPCTITGLSNGITYGIQLEAAASNMTGPVSNSATVTPSVIPFQTVTVSGTSAPIKPNTFDGAYYGKTTGICCSADARYVYYCNPNATPPLLVTNSSYGIGTWNPSTPNSYFSAVACDSTGKYMIALGSGNVYSSSNYGLSGSLNLALSFFSSNATSACMSYDGKYAAVSLYGGAGQVYVSNNYGLSGSWSSCLTSGGGYKGVCMSSDGRYMAVCSYGGNINGIFVNASYGVGSWTTTSAISDNGNVWTSICCDSTGKYIYGTVFYSYGLAINSNYGIGTWSYPSVNTSYNSYYTVCCDSTGQYVAVCNPAIVAVNSNYGNGTWTTLSNASGGVSICGSSSLANIFYTAAGVSGGIYTITSSVLPFQNITIATASAQVGVYTSICSNSTGKYLAACTQGSVYISSDYGVSFNKNSQTFVNQNLCICCSVTGQYISIGNAYVYTSSDYGVSWIQNSNVNTGGSEVYSICCSYTGQYQALAINGAGIYTNSTYGMGTWVKTSAINSSWQGICCDSTGQKISACAYQGSIYSNLSGGVGSWNAVTSFSGISWYAICSSSTGKYLYAIDNFGYIYITPNYGISGSWIQTNAPYTNWYSICCDSTGQFVAACNQGAVSSTSGIYVSTNYGISGSWKPTSLPANHQWHGICSDSTGLNLAVCNYDNSAVGIVTLNST